MLKKIVDGFTKLPRPVQLMLAMAGLGAPVGAFYLLKEVLFPTWSVTKVALVLLGVFAACFLLFMVIKWLFGSKSRKRAREMDRELTTEGRGGPMSMDASAAIKENNRKFKAAKEEMRKEFRVSVYEMPWFIVLGDSGCGKTRLVNESGLTFSGGKPEGYQLGTLNYNWWFTEDAIFIDMAGRLCNPQEDSDYQEWQAFLDTIARGRKGWPINGALVCVSAEHLLSDAPEKLEHDANIALERLRELQKKLGVTFATHLVVTKCDKILGFMPFFDRSDRDISMKNQIFGWARPGEFHEFYDPEQFEKDFNGIYGRLHELRLRRLNDEDEEVELGLAYTFPEEFRQLKIPLLTYIRTLFPLMKNPRAVKNLLFRGVFFTSATQKGSVILKRLSERLGNDAAVNFEPLEALYPTPRPHFLKDLLVRKVFPEQGLVFRNEQQALKHRKLARAFMVAAVALPVLMGGMLAWAATSFSGLIGSPRQLIAGTPGSNKPAPAALAVASPSGSMGVCGKLNGSVGDLRRSWSASFLSMGLGGAGQVCDDIETASRATFERGVLHQAFRDLAGALRTSDKRVDGAADTPAFRESLGLWLSLCSNLDDEGPPKRPALNDSDMRKMFALVKTPGEHPGEEVIAGIGWGDFTERLSDYVLAVNALREASSDEAPAVTCLNPVWIMTQGDIDPVGTACAGVDRLRRKWEATARLEKGHVPPGVSLWMDVGRACMTVGTEYKAILDADPSTITTDTFADFKSKYSKHCEEFSKALLACSRPNAADGRTFQDGIHSIREDIAGLRGKWMIDVAYLYKAFTGYEYKEPDEPGPRKTTGSENDKDRVLAAIEGLWLQARGGPGAGKGLDDVLAESLHGLGMIKEADLGLRGKSLLDKVMEVYTGNEHLVMAVPGADGKGIVRVGLTDNANAVAGRIDAGCRALGGVSSNAGAPDASLTLASMTTAIDAAAKVMEGARKAAKEIKLAGPHPEKWTLEKLGAHVAALGVLSARASMSTTLLTARAALEGAESNPWGIGSLEPGGSECLDCVYEIPCEREGRGAAPGRDQPAPPASRGTRGRPRPRGGAAAVPRTPVASGAAKGPRYPRYATRGFLTDAFQHAGELGDILSSVSADSFLEAERDSPAAIGNDLLQKGRQKYLNAYFQSWRDSFAAKRFPGLAELSKIESWTRLREWVNQAQGSAEVSKDLRLSLATLLEHVAWAEHEWADDAWKPDRDLLVASRRAIWDAKELVFVTRADAPANTTLPPWELIASQVADPWDAFGVSVRDFKDFPDDFKSDAPEIPGVSWPRLDKKTEDVLRGSVFLAELDQADRHCKELLDRYIHETLVKRQESYRSLASSTGYPYSPSDGDPFGTVPAEGFREFLIEMKQASKRLNKLANGLDSCKGAPARKVFFEQCGQWLDLIQPAGAQRAYDTDKGLVVTISPSDDPANRVWDALAGRTVPGQGGWSDANLHTRFAVWLGLSARGTGPAPPYEFVLRDMKWSVASGTGAGLADTVECAWKWPPQGTVSNLRIGLRGFNDIKGQPNAPDIDDFDLSKGGVSELWLPAFLTQAGDSVAGDGKKWRVAIQWDIDAVLDKTGRAGLKSAITPKGDARKVQCKFLFTLSDPIPEPVKPLQRMP